MFDDGGCPPSVSNPPWSSTQTELGSTTYLSATTTLFSGLHTLLTDTYGSNPRWWDGLNTCAVDKRWGYTDLNTSMNWFCRKILSGTIDSAYADTYSTEYLCTDSLWCPGQSTTNNPNGTVQFMQIHDFTQFGVKDGNGSSVSNYHLWDMSQRGPMNALAMFYMVQNPNLLFGYDPAGTYYAGFDDYYYWVKSAQTVAAPGISASTCTSGCSIPLSGQLETQTCPGAETDGCPIRIGRRRCGGHDQLYRHNTDHADPKRLRCHLNNYSAGASIEYAVVWAPVEDIPLHTPDLHVRDIHPGQRHLSWNSRFDVWLQHALHFKQLLHRWRVHLGER